MVEEEKILPSPLTSTHVLWLTHTHPPHAHKTNNVILKKIEGKSFSQLRLCVVRGVVWKSTQRLNAEFPHTHTPCCKNGGGVAVRVGRGPERPTTAKLYSLDLILGRLVLRRILGTKITLPCSSNRKASESLETLGFQLHKPWRAIVLVFCSCEETPGPGDLLHLTGGWADSLAVSFRGKTVIIMAGDRHGSHQRSS